MNVVIALIALVLLSIIWLVLDFSLGLKKHLASSTQKETPILHGDLDIFPHGKKLFTDYFAEIRAAKHHVHVLFYIIKNDPFSQEFFQLLKNKAQQGIEVRLLLDQLGGLKVKRADIQALKQAGVQFAYCNRIRFPFLFYTAQVRNHRKVSIIDGKIGYLGGFNIGKEYIDQDPKLSPWRDYHLKITGESVNFLQSEFLIDWRIATGENLQRDTFYFPKLHQGSVRHRLVPTECGQLEGFQIRLIQKAKRTILIGTPYFIPSKKVLNELLTALGRGVNLTILTPYTADHILVQEASYRFLRVLISAGAQVYQYKKGFYHAKVIVIDDKVCDVGTANFDNRSFFLNKEINCYIYDRPFIERLLSVLNQDILDSELMSLENLNKPNVGRAVKEAAAQAISFFL
ncbi:cardiolipin synthase [Neobacillus dielmonensis]|uniref:cardiolipin synthase n=1 Tax=Neobacillus dielmonensis TaxID=1347369 RepID=UPI0005A5E888|nr:cardiolipin synthase [Neobacillus dielmonensis]